MTPRRIVMLTFLIFYQNILLLKLVNTQSLIWYIKNYAYKLNIKTIVIPSLPVEELKAVNLKYKNITITRYNPFIPKFSIYTLTEATIWFVFLFYNLFDVIFSDGIRAVFFAEVLKAKYIAWQVINLKLNMFYSQIVIPFISLYGHIFQKQWK